MDQVYQAKLTGSPPGQDQPPQNQNQQMDNNGDIHIQPMPNPHTQQGGPGPGVIPVQLPNIYVTAPPPATQPQPAPSAPRREHRSHSSHTHTHQEPRMIHIGPFKFARPHPLLWITLGLSLIALVLEVPKGSLPTLTGRHRQLRTQEKLVQERLNLLTRLSTFLPPPLAHMIDPNPSTSATQRPSNLDLLRFWNANANANLIVNGNGFPYNGIGGGGDRWWSIEELGEGASVVRSKTGMEGGVDREVWVLRVGGDEHGQGGSQQPLLNALTHSLLLREQQQVELASLQCSQSKSLSISNPSQSPNQVPETHHYHGQHQHRDRDHNDESEHEHRSSERERRKKEKQREREHEIQEREEEVGRRERWVIEEMRKLTDKVHAEASELTLEDRITERLKSYQRQLNKMAEERDKEVVP